MSSTLLDVRDPSHVAEARRLSAASAAAASLGNSRSNDLAIVVTELTTNLLKHAGGGTLLLQGGSEGGVDVIALDQGAGIAEIKRSLEDG